MFCSVPSGPPATASACAQDCMGCDACGGRSLRAFDPAGERGCSAGFSPLWWARGRGLRGAFVLNPIKQLLAMNFDCLGGLDAEFDLAALLGEHFDPDVGADAKEFADAANEDENGRSSLLG